METGLWDSWAFSLLSNGRRETVTDSSKAMGNVGLKARTKEGRSTEPGEGGGCDPGRLPTSGGYWSGEGRWKNIPDHGGWGEEGGEHV